MNFKEFLIYEEDYEVFSSLNEGEIIDALLAAPKFAAGAAGNIVGQGLRGVGNLGSGGAESLYGTAQSGVSALQYLGGDKKAKEKAAKNFRSGLGRTAKGLGRALRGATQIAASPVSSLLRGAQAISDKKLGGILAPNDPKRSYLQDLLGLSSGSDTEKPPKDSVKSGSEEMVTPSLKKTPKKVSQKVKTTSSAPQEYYDLVDRLRRVTSKKEGVAITAELARKFPVQYAAARKRALELSRRRPSTNPSGLLRSGPGRPKPHGFGL